MVKKEMEITPAEIEETDRQNIKRVFEITGLSLKDDKCEDIRKAMLKAIALKQIAATALVDDDAKDPDILIALYTVALSSLVK